MEGSIIFTEASNDEVKRKHPFYGGLSKFLSKQKAIEIHEPEYKASMDDLRRQLAFGTKGFAEQPLWLATIWFKYKSASFNTCNGKHS